MVSPPALFDSFLDPEFQDKLVPSEIFSWMLTKRMAQLNHRQESSATQNCTSTPVRPTTNVAYLDQAIPESWPWG